MGGVTESIFRNDESEPDASRRRVVAAPPEGGWRWAKEHLEANPADIGRWNAIARSPEARLQLPVGTYETVRRLGDDPHQVAQTILRDACNHGMAIAQAGAECPLLLSKAEVGFLEVMAAMRSTDGSPGDGAAERSQRQAERQARVVRSLADVTTQLVDFLGRLGLARPPSAFIGHEGHDLLVEWMATLAESIKRYDPNDVDEMVSATLIRELQERQFHVFKPSDLGKQLQATMEFGVGAVGLSTALLGIADVANLTGIAGLLAGIVGSGSGLLKELGWIPAAYDGPQWPYLYVFGKRASGRRRDALLRQLGAPQLPGGQGS